MAIMSVIIMKMSIIMANNNIMKIIYNVLMIMACEIIM
jgi:hypothetical protein